LHSLQTKELKLQGLKWWQGKEKWKEMGPQSNGKLEKKKEKGIELHGLSGPGKTSKT